MTATGALSTFFVRFPVVFAAIALDFVTSGMNKDSPTDSPFLPMGDLMTFFFPAFGFSGLVTLLFAPRGEARGLGFQA